MCLCWWITQCLFGPWSKNYASDLPLGFFISQLILHRTWYSQAHRKFMPRPMWKENKTILYSSANIKEKAKIWMICLKCCDLGGLEIDNIEDIRYSGCSWKQPHIHSAKLSNSVLFQTWKEQIRPFPVLWWFVRLLQLLDPLALKLHVSPKTCIFFYSRSFWRSARIVSKQSTEY